MTKVNFIQVRLTEIDYKLIKKSLDKELLNERLTYNEITDIKWLKQRLSKSYLTKSFKLYKEKLNK